MATELDGMARISIAFAPGASIFYFLSSMQLALIFEKDKLELVLFVLVNLYGKIRLVCIVC
jgi:hypothetical protein